MLRFDGAADLMLSHGLHDNSGDFSVSLREDVQPALWPRLHETAVI